MIAGANANVCVCDCCDCGDCNCFIYCCDLVVVGAIGAVGAVVAIGFLTS